MPLVSVFMPGDGSSKDWSLVIGEQKIPYGVFLGDVVSFLILAMALFIFIVKFLGWIMQAKAAVAIEPPPVSEQRQALDVLIEIRDQLKQR